MSEMKLIMENWDTYLNEAEGEGAGITWSQLNGAIAAAQEIIEKDLTDERKKELLKILGNEAFELALSFAGPIGQLISSTKNIGKAVAKMFQTYAQQPDVETKGNPILSLFNLDDGFEDLIDDELEDAFIANMLPKIEAAAETAPDKVVDDMDKVVKVWLAQQDLSGTTGNSVMKTISLAKKGI